MPSDRDASISDAAFREAVRELIASARANPNWPIEQNDLPGQHTVERLYAERQGEEYGVGSMALHGPSGYRVILELPADKFKPGDRVRVVREEAK